MVGDLEFKIPNPTIECAANMSNCPTYDAQAGRGAPKDYFGRHCSTQNEFALNSRTTPLIAFGSKAPRPARLIECRWLCGIPSLINILNIDGGFLL
jgi:hypothetical protein